MTRAPVGFDLDMTLIDTPADMAAAAQAGARAVGVAGSFTDRDLRAAGRRSARPPADRVRAGIVGTARATTVENL